MHDRSCTRSGEGKLQDFATFVPPQSARKMDGFVLQFGERGGTHSRVRLRSASRNVRKQLSEPFGDWSRQRRVRMARAQAVGRRRSGRTAVAGGHSCLPPCPLRLASVLRPATFPPAATVMHPYFPPCLTRCSILVRMRSSFQQ